MVSSPCVNPWQRDESVGGFLNAGIGKACLANATHWTSLGFSSE
jgi:hypothetical protein